VKLSRLIIFVCGSILLGMLTMLALGVSQLGDCFDVETCSAAKRHDGAVVLTGSAIIYFVGACLLIWHWNRR
jgi:hypothetical protein